MELQLQTRRLRTLASVVVVGLALLPGCQGDAEPPITVDQAGVEDTVGREDDVVPRWEPPPMSRPGCAPTPSGLTPCTDPELIGGLEALQASVRYPDAARRTGLEGIVVAGVAIDAEGTVTNATVLRTAGPELDAEALRVVRAARFVPATKSGLPEPSSVTLPVRFFLSRSSSGTPELGLILHRRRAE